MSDKSDDPSIAFRDKGGVAVALALSIYFCDYGPIINGKINHLQ